MGFFCRRFVGELGRFFGRFCRSLEFLTVMFGFIDAFSGGILLGKLSFGILEESV